MKPLATITMTGHSQWTSAHSDPVKEGILWGVERLRDHGVEGTVEFVAHPDLFKLLRLRRVRLETMPADVLKAADPDMARSKAIVRSTADRDVRVELLCLVEDEWWGG